MTNKKKTKKQIRTRPKGRSNLKKIIASIIGFLAVCLSGVGITIIVQLNQGEEPEIVYKLELSSEQIPAEIVDDKGEIVIDEEVPTVEEVDGGLFKDKDTGVSITEGMYEDLGWSEWYPTDTPTAFKDATLGKCIYANNYYGAQCVSLARVFWWSYADRDVSTCGTGMAKGMMNCFEENAGDEFEVYWSDAKYFIQAGDWLIFDGGMYGHVGMALGGYNNGYVALLGENQGGIPCEGGGSSTNIINISLNKLIGFYRPKAYIIPEPTPEPEAPDTGITK